MTPNVTLSAGAPGPGKRTVWAEPGTGSPGGAGQEPAGRPRPGGGSGRRRHLKVPEEYVGRGVGQRPARDPGPGAGI